MGFLSRLFGRDQKAMPDPGSPEFEAVVQGSALPGSVEMGDEGWARAGEVQAGGIAGGLTTTSIEVEGQQPVQIQGAVTEQSLIAAGVPPEQARQAAAAMAQMQAFGAASYPIAGIPGMQDAQVTQGQPQTLDLQGMQGLRDEMMETLRRHGVDPESGQSFDVSQVAGLQEELLAVLAKHGVDISQYDGQGWLR